MDPRTQESHIDRAIFENCEAIDRISILPQPEQGNAVSEVVTSKVATLEQSAFPGEQINTFTPVVTEYIGPKTEVKATITRDGFLLDDKEVYTKLIENIVAMKNGNMKDSKTRDLLLLGIFTTINQYYGNVVTGDSTLRSQFYDNISDTSSSGFSISEMKGKGIAECIEKSAMAHNLLLFCGFDSSLVISSSTKFEQSSPDGHAFLHVNNGKITALVELTNPTMVTNSEGKIVSVYPAIYPLSEEQEAKFDKGLPVELTHYDIVVKADGTQEMVSSKRTYCKK